MHPSLPPSLTALLHAEVAFTNSAIASTPAATDAATASSFLDKLECTVCFQLPETTVNQVASCHVRLSPNTPKHFTHLHTHTQYKLPNPVDLRAHLRIRVNQCYNGHIMCAGCLLTLREHRGEASHICPTCRANLGPIPIRNLWAETFIGDYHTSQCDGCSAFMVHKDLVAHHQRCERVTVECPFHFAMCTARPRRAELDAHMDTSQADHLELLAVAPVSAANRIVALLSGGGTDTVKEAAAGALLHLSCNDSTKVAITQAGAIPPLAAMLRGGTDDVKQVAAQVLRNLSFNNDNQVVIAWWGAIPSLVVMLNWSGADRLKQAATEALRNLSFDNTDNQAEIARWGAIPSLVAMLSGDGTDRFKEAAAEALANLACNNADNKATITRAGAIDPLRALMSVGGTDEVKDAASGALRNLGVGRRLTYPRAAKRERD